EFFTGLGDRAAMHRFGLGPQPATASVFEEFTGFAVDSAMAAADGQGKQENDQFRKGKLANSDESFGVVGTKQGRLD
ncbi:MAG: hypothetical protein ACU843_18490, partial [Gammaproteobacteria bacterium]